MVLKELCKKYDLNYSREQLIELSKSVKIIVEHQFNSLTGISGRNRRRALRVKNESNNRSDISGFAIKSFN